MPDLFVSDFLTLFYYFTFASFLIVIFAYDLKYKLIPDFATTGIFALFGLRLLTVFMFYILEFGILNLLENWKLIIANFAYDVLIAAATLIFFGALWYFSSGRAMGFGDVKLAPALVLFLGASKGVLAILFSFWLGAAVGILLMLLKKARWKSEIPFGPFLALGSFISLLFGSQLIEVYLRIF